ncbi:COG1361 family protein [Methanolobus profundi]|uniref:Uncharacterized protein n=1 Tax=Methanolobus profundi TaxID=487685 RepID=A0A1I4R9L9_9EURY|nr:DUF11 domain-containing protein [Methanolobus profundi]SFM48909.1 hypothetical protein SAMN04488696_1446 [Methanolobus profundi]
MPIKKLFFLIAILLILTANANALGIREEDIWIFQGAYELGIGDRAYLEGFTLKVYEIDSTNEASTTLLIYRNAAFKEAFEADTGLNNEYIYNSELKIDVIDIDNDVVSLEIYKKKTELVWINDIPKTSFKTGDTLSGDNYRITLAGINEEGALIEVEYEGEQFEGTYVSGEHQKFSDEFMINIIYLKKDTKEVFIETLKPGAPQIMIENADLKDSYEPNEYVEYELIVTNNGTIPLHGIMLTTESDDGNVEVVSQQHSILEQGKSKVFQIKVDPDIEPMGNDINIISKVQGYDYRGNEYNTEATTVAHVKPYIAIEKEVISKDKPSEDPEFGTEQYFQILITLENKANFQTAVTVTDELPESFIPDDLEDTEWVLSLDAGETKTIEYFASPTEPGDFTFTPATVVWKDGGETYTLTSEEIDQTFHVSGSKVVLTKRISSSYMLIGEEITVQIIASNDGDRTIDASFQETIPEELAFVKGDDNWQGTLEAGESREFSYTLRAQSAGEIYIPGTELSYTNENDRKDKATTDEIFLYIDEPLPGDDEVYFEESYAEENIDYTPVSHTTEPVEMTGVGAAGFLASSFIGLFVIIALVPAFAYLYIIRIYK